MTSERVFVTFIPIPFSDRKNKEMKENLKKFREEAKKLEESEALKEARGKFSKVLEKSDSGVIKEKLDELKDSEFVKASPFHTWFLNCDGEIYMQPILFSLFFRKPPSLRKRSAQRQPKPWPRQ